MPSREDSGSHYENHQQVRELQDQPAHAHRAAAETHNKQDHPTGQERSRQAHEHSLHAEGGDWRSHSGAVNQHHVALFGHEDIAALAHALWQARGCPEGSPEEDWFQAARQLRGAQGE